MSSYNQTRTIMEELRQKIQSASSVPNKKAFVVVLEGTESEFDEIRKLGGIEIEDINALSKLSSAPSGKNSINYTNHTKINSSGSNHCMDQSIYVGTGSVVTENDVAKLSEQIIEIVLKERGMITPLAKDLAKKRGIKVTRIKS